MTKSLEKAALGLAWVSAFLLLAFALVTVWSLAKEVASLAGAVSDLPFLTSLAGSLSLAGLTLLFATPAGVSLGIYFAFHKRSRLRALVWTLASLPSLLVGFLGYHVTVLLRQYVSADARACLLLAALCLSVLVLPLLIKISEAAFVHMREHWEMASCSLGLSRSQTLRHIFFPLARPSLQGGLLLAGARVLEDTAVVLLTGAVYEATLPPRLTGAFSTLSFQIFYLSSEYRSPLELSYAFTLAAVLVVISSSLFFASKWVMR